MFDTLVMSHLTLQPGSDDPSGMTELVPGWIAWGFLFDSSTGLHARQPGGGVLTSGVWIEMLADDVLTGDHLTRLTAAVIGQFRATGDHLQPADPDPVVHWPNVTAPGWPLPAP